jgi:E-phenylitaconyl-CoA hydratase
MSILFEKQGKIAIITINRPEAMNALDMETHHQLCDAWTDFRDDPDLWVGILTGAGDRAFCSGADLKKMLPEVAGQTPLERMEDLQYRPSFGGITKRLRIYKPLIAAINGICLAGGLEMALACDLRIAAENSIFGLMEVQWGIIPGAGGTQRLPRLVPLAKAMEMILLAEKIDAKEALRLGIVNKVVPFKDVIPSAMEMAKRICTMGPLAVRAAKAAILRGLDLSLDEALALEDTYQEFLLRTEDAAEGPKAFKQKRIPNFKGK